jgi:hypothetical protein
MNSASHRQVFSFAYAAYQVTLSEAKFDIRLLLETYCLRITQWASTSEPRATSTSARWVCRWIQMCICWTGEGRNLKSKGRAERKSKRRCEPISDGPENIPIEMV